MTELNKYVRKTTGETVIAAQWIPGETDNEVRSVILSNVQELVLPEEAEGFVTLTMAISDAHPKDWIIASSSSAFALTPEAFDRAYEPYIEVN